MYRAISLTCLSAALLAPIAAWAQAAADTPAGTVTPETATGEALSPFMRQRNAVVQAVKNKQWKQATALAQSLLELTLPEGNPYEQLDVSELLFTLQHQQGLHAQNLQLADRMLAAAASAKDGAVSGQVSALAQRGVMSAMVLQDSAAVARYQQVLRQDAPLFPAQWQWDSQAQRLTFQTAQLSVPTLFDRWVLVAVEAASDRSDASRLRYMYVKPNGQRMFATMQWRYDEDLVNADAAARTQMLDHRMESYAAASGGAAVQVAALAQPELPIAGALQKRKLVRVASQEGADAVHMHWVALWGQWAWHMEVQAQQADHALAVQAASTLWQAVQWPQQAPDLPQLASQPSLPWRSPHDWPKAGQLAREALGDARFPSEVARLNTVAGIAAFKAGEFAEAQQWLDTALQAWPYASVFDSTLIDNAQQYGAAMALRRGDSPAAAALLRQYLRNAGGLSNVLALSPDKRQAWIDNRRTGMRLPLQAAGLFMQEPDRWERIVFRDLSSEMIVGLTSGMPIPADDAQQEALLRKALVQQFQLQPGALRKQRFVSKLAAPGQPARSGQHWVFEVQPVATDAGGSAQPAAPVRQVLFWLVDQGAQRAILRASVANAQQARQARQLALALRW